MDGATDKTESSCEQDNLEDDTFLWQLTDEERESLQYLLETINSLDAEEQDSNNDEHVNYSKDNSQSFAISGKIPKGLNESSTSLGKTKPDPSPIKMKIIKSFSEDCPGCSITVTPEVSPRLASSHPSHLRKFDTIMRSGVNVKELRARFIQHQNNSSFDENPKGSELSVTSKQQPQVSRNLMSPRQEALQKLGLLNKKQSNPVVKNVSDTQHCKDQSSSTKNCEQTQHLSWGGAVSLPSSELTDGHEALTESELVKF
ncbi:uncharacterized protein LOC128635842 [Bombina bombina]|uniref:uncharacterized protein LOC128635842 n=1 Tax=Bombina bombina TaxID=8345 RepID=UPI00235ADB48|nr:uncharacterized protein LOC128635842 [Bombina bombina]